MAVNPVAFLHACHRLLRVFMILCAVTDGSTSVEMTSVFRKV